MGTRYPCRYQRATNNAHNQSFSKHSPSIGNALLKYDTLITQKLIELGNRLLGSLTASYRSQNHLKPTSVSSLNEQLCRTAGMLMRLHKLTLHLHKLVFHFQKVTLLFQKLTLCFNKSVLFE